ncbi:hypothetical protein QOZ80_7BG0603760 [Eleusine coracana subsp. coracana]|nr:hypothetical protein QOZ80_7BG0603760 [Eleusine coracana subsp. coracana]
MSSSHHADASSSSSTPRSNASGGNGGNGQHPRPPTMASSHHGDSSASASTPRSNTSGNNGGNGHHLLPPLPPAPAPVQVAPAPPVPVQANAGPQVRLMTSFGGCILPRPGDRRLRYVGGDTRIVSLPRATASYATLVAAFARIAPNLFAPGAPHPTLKYKLPQDDIDSLISISSDDDVDHLMDELDRLEYLNANVAKPDRLRAFIFAPQPHAAGAFGSIFSGAGGEAACDQWFLDALNAPTPSSGERDSSSMMSDLPDCLFGLDIASDEPSPSTNAARNKSDPETPSSDDDAPAPAAGEGEPSHAPSVGSPWPAPPPPYMGQPVYYFPVQPVHYPSVQSGGYIPRPVYTMVGGGGSEQPVHIYPAPGGMGGVYGVPHPLQPLQPMVYAPPRPVVHTAEGKPPSEKGAQSSPQSSP